jgi:hypothetical protein
MRSIIDIAWSAPKIEGDHVVIRLGVHCTDDDAGDPREIRDVIWWPTFISVSPQTVASGQDRIETVVSELIETQRASFGPFSLARLHKEAIEQVRKHDLSACVHPGWAGASPDHQTYQ